MLQDDKDKIAKALLEDGHVADADIPDTARKPAGEEGGVEVDPLFMSEGVCRPSVSCLYSTNHGREFFV